MNAETLLKWKEAGVLIQWAQSSSGVDDHWGKPELIGDPEIMACMRAGRFIPYRDPGHIQPHDGSSERPEWVAEDALVLARLTSSAGSAWVQISAKLHLWQAVDYFIVLPSIGGNNEN